MEKKEIILSKATRNELIEELRKRDAITSVMVRNGEGANIVFSNSNIAISVESFVFVIEPFDNPK